MVNQLICYYQIAEQTQAKAPALLISKGVRALVRQDISSNRQSGTNVRSNPGPPTFFGNFFLVLIEAFDP